MPSTQDVLLVCAFVLALYALRVFSPMLKAKAEQMVNSTTPEDWEYWAGQLGLLAVKAAEQVGGSNEEKKMLAVEILKSLFTLHGLPFAASIIDAVVESSVYDLKQEKLANKPA